MLPETQKFVNEQFRQYYRNNDMQLPSSIEKREWGIIPDGGKMHRHIAFKNKDVLKYFMVENAPAHVYHSVAYYTNPGAPTMEEKEWNGADLIFDIDADPEHMPKAIGKPYREQLELAKEETKKLVDEFLIGELGFDKSQLELAFSGGRGYHVHITDASVLGMQKDDRREIVDYITGMGVDLNNVLFRVTNNTESRKFTSAGMIWKVRGFEQGGWGKRISKYLYDEMTSLASNESAADYIKNFATKNKITVGGKKVDDILRFVSNADNRTTVLNTGELRLGDSGMDEFFQKLVAGNVDKISKKYGCCIDGQVSTDVRRLIRVPGSLHGKTALKAVPMDYDTFLSFDPLKDAVAFNDETPVPVNVKKIGVIDLKGKRFTIKSEGRGKLPLFLAIHMFCQGMAEYSA